MSSEGHRKVDGETLGRERICNRGKCGSVGAWRGTASPDLVSRCKVPVPGKGPQDRKDEAQNTPQGAKELLKDSEKA